MVTHFFFFFFLLQNVHVHLLGWTGGPDALWDVPGPGDEDGKLIGCSIFNVVCFHLHLLGRRDTSLPLFYQFKRCLSTCVLQKKRLPVKIEKGTGGMNDVDISWIPQETLNVMSMFVSRVRRDSGCLRCDNLLISLLLSL